MGSAIRNESIGPHGEFFGTHSDLFGLGPPGCCPGDAVCSMVIQCPSFSDHMERSLNSWKRLRHGAMNGEALPSESQDDAEVDFVLR